MLNKLTRRSLLSICSFALAILPAAIAQAHSGHGETVVFLHGLEHPMGGLDHILAMLAVGQLN